MATAIVGAWLLTVALIAPIAPASAAGNNFSFTDHFSSGQYNGNDGSVDYDSPWWEYGDWGGSNKGAVAVVDAGNCPHGPCARIAGEGELWGTGLARRANIEEAATAKLRFKYRLAIEEPSTGKLDIAASDGWNWYLLDSIDLTGADGAVHSRTYEVIDYAAQFFSVGFFASGEWHGAAYIDDVEVSGTWVDTTTIAEPSTTSSTTTSSTTTSSTTTAPTTTTSSPPSTTNAPPPSTTTAAPPNTTTTAAPPNPTTTAAPPTTTTKPPKVTTTTKAKKPKKTGNPPAAGVAPTTRPPSTEAPLMNDERYRDKGALAIFYFDDDTTNATGELATMPGELELPEPGPVTQIMASITVTAVTIRSHLLSAIALGLLIAAAAVIGLGRREETL